MRSAQLVLTLSYADECTVKEIAELLQMKENTVKTWLARGREQQGCLDA
ncbi:MAG: sigma-70 region 4 domain-containing protein [Lachnospiraceae bacterium]